MASKTLAEIQILDYGQNQLYWRIQKQIYAETDL